MEIGQQVGPRLTRDRIAAVVEQERKTCGLDDRYGHRQIASPLGDLALADRALLLPLLDPGYHHAEYLHDDGRRDVWHDTQGEHGEAGQGPAGEKLEESQNAPLVRPIAEQLDLLNIDAGGRHKGTHPVEQDHEQGEHDPLTQISHPEHIQHAGQHVCSCLWSGPDEPVSGSSERYRWPVGARRREGAISRRFHQLP